jgi:hypothetical protein
VFEITDGGAYCPFAVAFNRGETLPGLDVLSDWRKWRKVRRYAGDERVLDALGGLSQEEWKQAFFLYNEAVQSKDKAFQKEFENNVNQYATDHVASFWKPYDLEFEFGLEHKIEHTAWEMGYLGKSDYCMLPVGGRELIIKKRGSKPAGEFATYEEIDPGFEMLVRTALGNLVDYKHRGFKHSRLCKVQEYQQTPINKVPVSNPETLAELKTAGEVVPGWEIQGNRDPRQMNNKHIYIRDHAMYEAIAKRKDKDRGERLQWFERYINDAEKMVKTMNDNDLRLPAKKAKKKF